MTIFRYHREPALSAQAEILRSSFDRVQGARRTSPIPRERFIWDYWHIPEHYTYFRTVPGLLFAGQDADFQSRLLGWAAAHLGSQKVNTTWLSYYISNCTQELHRDLTQGSWAFVYNLCPPTRRRFAGGRTYLLKEDHVLDQGETFYTSPHKFELIDLAFGELLIFDGSIPHGVERVSETMDPQEGRLVLHGWFSEAVPLVVGADVGTTERFRAFHTNVLTPRVESRCAHLSFSRRVYLTYALAAEDAAGRRRRVLLTRKGDLANEARNEIDRVLDEVDLPNGLAHHDLIVPVCLGT